MGQDAEWSDSRQGQTLALRAYLYIYVLTCTKYTPNLTLLPLPKSGSLSGGGDQVLKHLNFQGTFPIQSITEIILPYNQRCVGRLCAEKRQFLLFGLLLQICHLGRSCDFINTALARKAQNPVCGDILRVI